MEIEIKAIVKDKKMLTEKLSRIGAVLLGERTEKDIYYRKSGPQGVKEYVRLRVREDTKIFAHHSFNGGATKELEFEVVGTSRTILKVLSLIGLKIIGSIKKKRAVYTYKEFTISVDDLKQFGQFIEIEVEGKASEVRTKKRQCLSLLEKLGLGESDLTDIWYCNLVLNKAEL